MKNSIHVAICVMLVVAVLAMSLSVFAADEDEEINFIQVKEGMAAYYIWEFLHAVGIDVTLYDVWEYSDYVADTIIDWVINYIADEIEADSLPSNYSIAQWIAPWTVGYDYWGNLRYNSTMLEDMQDFAEWLKNKFSLIDNSTIVLNPNYTVSGYNLYEYNKYYDAWRINGATTEYVAIEYLVSNGETPLGFFVATIDNGDGTKQTFIVHVSTVNNNTFTFSVYGMTANDTGLWLNSGSVQSWTANNNGYYQSTSPAVYWMNGALVPSGNNFEGSNSEYTRLLQNFDIEMEGNTKIVTTDIVFPYENPSYTPGDGMTIIDGSPEYSVINIDNVTVDNLPAIVSQGTITNPGLETFWGFIPVLAEQTKDAIVLTRGLIYELPEELVVTFYAVMGGLILFGVIKLMREH